MAVEHQVPLDPDVVERRPRGHPGTHQGELHRPCGWCRARYAYKWTHVLDLDVRRMPVLDGQAARANPANAALAAVALWPGHVVEDPRRSAPTRPHGTQLVGQAFQVDRARWPPRLRAAAFSIARVGDAAGRSHADAACPAPPPSEQFEHAAAHAAAVSSGTAWSPSRVAAVNRAPGAPPSSASLCLGQRGRPPAIDRRPRRRRSASATSRVPRRSASGRAHVRRARHARRACVVGCAAAPPPLATRAAPHAPAMAEPGAAAGRGGRRGNAVEQLAQRQRRQRLTTVAPRAAGPRQGAALHARRPPPARRRAPDRQACRR